MSPLTRNKFAFIHTLAQCFMSFLLYFVCMSFLTGLHEATIKFSQNQTRFAAWPKIPKALQPQSYLLVKSFTDNLVIENSDNLNPRLRFSKLFIVFNFIYGKRHILVQFIKFSHLIFKKNLV